MIKMKTTFKRSLFAIIAIMALVALSTDSFAQRGGDRKQPTVEERVKKEVKMMNDNLDLTEKQRPQIESISKKYAKLYDKLRDSGKDRKEMMEKMREYQKDKNVELEKVLTTKQYKKYQKLVEEERQKMMQRRRR